MYPRVDRYASLREILRRPLKGTADIIKLACEIGYGVLNVADDQQNILAGLARIEKNFLEYIEDSLRFRQKRMEHEGGYEDNELIDTQDLLDKLKDHRLMVMPVTQTRHTETTVQLPPAEKKPGWLTDKVINLIFTLLGGILFIIVQAVLKLSFGGK